MKTKYKNPKLNEISHRLDKLNNFIPALEEQLKCLDDEKLELIKELKKNTYHIIVYYEVGLKIKDSIDWYNPTTDDIPRAFYKDFIEEEKEAKEYINYVKKELTMMIGKEISVYPRYKKEINGVIQGVNITKLKLEKGDETILIEENKRKVSS